jgi:hypothetical protein
MIAYRGQGGGLIVHEEVRFGYNHICSIFLFQWKFTSNISNFKFAIHNAMTPDAIFTPDITRQPIF